MKLLTILFFTICSQISGQMKLDTIFSSEQNYQNMYHPWMKYGSFIPQNIDECIIILMHHQELNTLLSCTLEEARFEIFTNSNYSFRENWDLSNHSQLAEYFYNHKIYSPHTMRDLIAFSYYQYLKNCRTDFGEIIREEYHHLKKNEQDAFKTLKKEVKSEIRQHKILSRKIRKERRKALKLNSKGQEFDDILD